MKPSALQGHVPWARAPIGSDDGGTSGGSEAAIAPATNVVGSVAVVVLANFEPASRLWAWMRLVLGTRPLRGIPGLGFAKVLGSGADGGFGLKPSGTHRGLFLVFDNQTHAQDFVDRSPLLAAWRQRAREVCVALLRASSSKGSWDGKSMAVTAAPPVDGPIVALTRASIRLPHALAFWRLSPPAEVDLHAAPGCELAVGLGEAPLLRQATFSLWRSVDDMNRYARGGAHQQAIRTAYAGHYFSESMFVRFVPISIQGRWQGQDHG